MKYLFVHDHILFNCNGNYYSSGGLNNDVLKRYLYNKNDKIILYTRQQNANENEVSGKTKISDKSIICKPSVLYKGPKHYFKKKQIIRTEIKSLVEESDLIILRIPSFLSYFVLEEAKKQNKKCIFEMVACPWDSLWNHSSKLGKLLAPFMYLKTKKVCKNAKNIVYVSNSFLQKRYPTNGNTVAISNVNIMEVNDDVLEKRLIRISNFNLKKKIKIGLIGGLNVNYKGHYEAIMMANILKNKSYNFELHFLGFGNEERWKKLVKKFNLEHFVFFDGVLPSGQPVLKWIDNIDIYIIPSLQEGLPRSLIEAMSRGCPSVGMRTGGIPELIDNEYVCKRKNYKQLAYNVERLINSKEELKSQAIKNFNESKKYLKKDLDNKRKNFFEKVINIL